MTEYRAFFLDEEGHIFSAHGFDAMDDEEALQEARRLVDGHDIELWQEARKVGLVKRD